MSLSNYLRSSYRGRGVKVEVLFGDTFTDLDGTLLTAHTPETGQAWLVDAGTWEINTNKARRTDAIIATRCRVASIGATEYTLTSDTDVTGTAGFHVRCVDAINRFECRIAPDATTLRIDEITADVRTTRATTTIPKMDGLYAARVVVTNSKITFRVVHPDGNIYSVEYASTTHNTGEGIGLGAASSTTTTRGLHRFLKAAA